MKTTRIDIGIILLYILLYLLPLGNRPLTIPDETRYAEIPREMLSTGDWVVPHLNGLRYFEKPPLAYWANALSIKLFGDYPFAVRLPGALAAGLTTLFIFLFVRRTTGKQHLALLSAFIHMTFLEVYFVGTFSVPDNLLTLFLTGGIMTFYLAAREERPRRVLGYWVISGLIMGLAFLTKGFLALAIPVIILVPLMLWLGRWQALLSYGPLVVISALIIILPWAVLVHLREGDFWHYFFWVEHIQRFSADNAQHKAPFYYFLIYLPGLAFPWIALAPAAVAGLVSTGVKKERQPLLSLLWLWLLLPFIFFSIASGKLGTYILPCFPPLAVLIAMGLFPYLHRRQTKLFDFGILFNLLILLGLLIALSITQFTEVGYALYGENEEISLTIAMITLVAGIIGGLIAFTGKRPFFRLGAAALLILPFVFVGQLALPGQALESKGPGMFLNQFHDMVNKDTVIISDGSMVHSVCWYFKRDDAYLISGGELHYGLSYPDATGRLLDQDSFSALVKENRSQHPVAIFCRKSCPEKILMNLPDDTQRHSYGRFLMFFIPSNQHSG